MRFKNHLSVKSAVFQVIELAAILAVATSSAQACSCAKSSRAQAITSSNVVFQGRVTQVYRDGQRLYANLTVIRPLKGQVRTSVEVSTALQSAACGYQFRPGQVLIVGATFRDRQYRTNLCLMLPLNRPG
ncbi:MAG: hypothetical protein NWT00_07615 [Beijerinckiaceae bacterium]|jgi:hypothetical protein|nr:hypothetical protein [Beijerinckiaceae bacterium]